MSSWAADVGVELKIGGGREVLRILTRLWSEDSSTPISIKSVKPTGRNTGKTNKAGSNKKRPTAQQKRGRGGASVEKPDTSLARQFKHPERKKG